MTRISSRQLRDDLAETLNQVAYGGETVRIHRRGKNLAVIIPESAYAAYEAWESKEDARLLEAVQRSEEESAGEETVPAEELFAELGI